MSGKRQRSASSSRVASLDGAPPSHFPPADPGGFNDPVTADVLLRLQFDPDPDLDPDAPSVFLDLHVQSAALRRSQYFAALLSDRWQRPDASSDEIPRHVSLKISSDEDHRRGLFDDYVDVLRRQFDPDPDLDPDAPSAFLNLHVQSAALRRSQYFAALLSDRWQRPDASSDEIPLPVSLKISSGEDRRRGLFDDYVDVLRLLHTLDFSGAIASVSDALDMMPVALELLFDEGVRACVRFLEAVPWSELEEERVLKLIPFLGQEESQQLLARITPVVAHSGNSKSMSEEMLHGLIDSAIRRHPNVATVKAFVARTLKDFPCRESVERVLSQAFLSSLETVKDYLGKYASPDVRVAENSDEREAIQRVNLHTVMMNSKHLYWLVERIIEVRVADTAVREWSEQEALAGDLIKTFMDDTWKNIAPGLPLLVTRCSYRLADAVASGTTLVPQQVRKKLVKHWLPVLNALRDMSCPFPPNGYRNLYLDLEETFLKIISTLPLSDAQELLQQCLSFSTRNVDDCPHLISAFKTWFRRANRPPHNSKMI